MSLSLSPSRSGLVLVAVAIVALCAGCGRSGLNSPELADVTVGLTSTSGSTLTVNQVAASLDRFAFDLSRFVDVQWCDKEPCLWAAQGSLPASWVEPLNDYQDTVLDVVYVVSQVPDETPPY
jgi:hypothetical protein